MWSSSRRSCALEDLLVIFKFEELGNVFLISAPGLPNPTILSLFPKESCNGT